MRESKTLLFTCLWSLTALGSAGAQPPTAPPCVVENREPGVGGRFELAVHPIDPPPVALSGFATSSGAADIGWSVQLLTPGGENSLLMVTEGTGRPAPGTYRIADYVATDASPQPNQYIATAALAGQILGASGLFSLQGTLTIVSSTPTAVVGCFDFSAGDMQRKSILQVDGNFAAKNQDFSP